MPVSDCTVCNIVLNRENKVKRRNFCHQCYEQQEEQVQEIVQKQNVITTENEEISGRKCNTCNIVKPEKAYTSKKHRKCKACPKKKRPRDYTKLVCNSCEVPLTPETETSGKNKCKPCNNLYQREREQMFKDSGITEKQCETCGEIKPLKKFRRVFHHECMVCDKNKHTKITEEEYKSLHPELTEKLCILCKTIKPIARFCYHTSSYRNQCRDCINGFKRYIKYRLNLIESIGIEAYRKRNTEQHRKWVDANKGHVDEYSYIFERTIEGISSMYFTFYKTRNIGPLIQLMTKEKFKEMVEKIINKPCYYCNRQTKEGSLEKMIAGDYNGIDRLDSNQNYSYENCVSCCSHCNMMKNSLDIGSFIRKCCEIAEYNNLVELDIHTDYRFKIHNEVKLVGYSGNFSSYKSTAKKRELSFELSKKIFEDITHSPCYICGKEGQTGIGIDRFNNNIGYIESNCKPCCNYCNYMKKNYDYNVFIDKIQQIVLNTYNKECLKSLCLKSHINHIFTANELPYENDIYDLMYQ